MGQEILYCYKCQIRLMGSEFEKGKAFKVGGQASCAVCVKDLIGSVPPAAYETDRGRKLASTARIPLPNPESSGKMKSITNRSVAPPPPPDPAEKSKAGLVIGATAAIFAVVLLIALALGSGSSRRTPPGPTPPTPPQPPIGRSTDPVPLPPTPPPAGFAADLREIDEKMRSGLANEEFKQTAALLDEARKRRNTPEWLSEIDLRIPQVEGRARRASMPLREKAIEAQKKSDAAAVGRLRDQVAAWGFPGVVDDFNRALADAAAPPVPPTPPVKGPEALVLYAEGMAPGVRDHSWSCKLNLVCTDKAFEGTKSLSYAPERPWAGVFLGHDSGFELGEYPYVSFALYPTIENPNLTLALWGPDKNLSTAIGFSKLGPPLKAGEWRKFVVPVSSCGPSSGRVTGFIIQSGPVSSEPLFYLDNVMFLKTAPDSAAPPVPAPDAGGGKWMAAALKAAARDYDGAQKEVDEPGDVELLKLAAQVPVEAAKVIDKWTKGQKVRLEVLGGSGERLPVEGSVLAADTVRVTVAREDGPFEVPLCEIAPAGLAEIFRNRPDRKPQDARAAAAFCAFEGDLDGMKKFSGENAALPEKYMAFAQKRASLMEVEAAARRSFWTAEGEFAYPKRRSAAIEALTALQALPEAARLRPFIAARLESARDTLLQADDLSGAGSFALTGNAKVDLYWSSNVDSAPSKAKENYVEAEFYCFPGTTMKAWVWAGACCQETFDASWQATELTIPNPKNSKEPVSCEPGADAAPSLKMPFSLRKWHAQHGGPKEPLRWEWIPLTLPKYEAAGPKRIRILTAQQGFSVAAIAVSATRRNPPTDAEMKELEKSRAAARKGGGNEPTGTIVHEWWGGIDGNNVEDLVKSPVFQGKPSGTSVRDLFEAPRDIADRFGSRMRGFIHAPVTGNYTFWIASDDGSELYLSADETPTKKRAIANCPYAAGIRDWTRAPSCKSAPILLTAGKRYYIEALQKDGGGNDHVAVGWTLPDGTDERPIPGKRLSPWMASGTPVAAPLPVGTGFYRAISLNGPAATIDSRRWEGKGAPDVTSSTECFENMTVPLVPPTDEARSRMIRSSVFTKDGSWVKMDKVPPGSYQVYLYVWEDNISGTFDILVQGAVAHKGYNSGAAGHWDRLGPYPATVTTGTIEVRSGPGGDANFSGLEVWRTGK
ncbi:MAG TPA: PA14 domain-containing protein [Planctomycetota bacterium]|nr:PA14 domain-containing protein [Planctomycetota bacterium]